MRVEVAEMRMWFVRVRDLSIEIVESAAAANTMHVGPGNRTTGGERKEGPNFLHKREKMFK